MSDQTLTAQDWALRYASLGWRVYPVEPGRKKALFTGWLQGATTDPEVVARQWRREPYPGVGVVCGESFAVFDIEERHLGRFFAYLDRGGHAVPETAVSSTGGGGLHLYTQLVPGVVATRRLTLDGVHIGEFKTTGGVVAPPSVTSGPYRWLWWPDDPSPAGSPAWLSALISIRPRPDAGPPRGIGLADPAAALDALARAVRDEPEGNRNAVLFWAARRAREEGIRADIAEAVLRRAALANGLDAAEVSATISSAFTRQIERV